RAAPAPPSTVSTSHDSPETTSTETFTFYDTLDQQSSPPPGLIDPSLKSPIRSPSRSASLPSTEAASSQKHRSSYTIQIAAIKDRSAAQALSDRLKRKGYPVFILPHIVPKQGTWYRVRVGHFTKRAAAQDMAQRLSRQERLTTYVALE
ncbi:MAG: SPOR domain-containing protein, partial [Nitrospirae bacterium]|nr:SPOR domain-containing protein [Nitrospirota bacterium]